MGWSLSIGAVEEGKLAVVENRRVVTVTLQHVEVTPETDGQTFDVGDPYTLVAEQRRLKLRCVPGVTPGVAAGQEVTFSAMVDQTAGASSSLAALGLQRSFTIDEYF